MRTEAGWPRLPGVCVLGSGGLNEKVGEEKGDEHYHNEGLSEFILILYI